MQTTPDVVQGEGMTMASSGTAIDRDGFHPAAEADVDARRRVSLGKVGRAEHTRYQVLENDLGEILLVPLVSVPARELIVWEDAQVRSSLARGMEQAAAGQVTDLGSFAEFAADDEDDDPA
jgi:hypothetical protein